LVELDVELENEQISQNCVLGNIQRVDQIRRVQDQITDPTQRAGLGLLILTRIAADGTVS
jgi:hypothetical protein